jgi:hypothetical protein
MILKRKTYKKGTCFKIKTTTSSGGLLFPYKGMVLACAEALQFGLPTA